MTQNAQNKRPRGRTPGWSPGETRTITHRVGQWSWNHNKLISKLVKGQNEDDCWQWQGAVSPAANLFGAYKNGRPQMTQVNRLLAMAETGLDLEGKCVYMRCGDFHCSNPQHFFIQTKIGGNKREIYV